MNVTRTDDNNLDGFENTAFEDSLLNLAQIYNPEIIPPGFPNAGQPGKNGMTNELFRLVRFRSTGTGDAAIIYLWNTKENRRELPNPTDGQTLSNLYALGVPPGLKINDPADQTQFFAVADPTSTDDSYYHTLVVNPITGSVAVHDYAWGYGTPQWDRKKDGD